MKTNIKKKKICQGVAGVGKVVLQIIFRAKPLWFESQVVFDLVPD